MWEYNYTTELYHHGIKGMKWGVRRYQNKDGSLTSAGRKRYSDDAEAVRNLRKKSVNELSNAELKKLTERQQLEQNYRRLNPNKVKKGLTVAGTVAASMGTVVSLYKNGNQIIKIGKKVAKAFPKKELAMIAI